MDLIDVQRGGVDGVFVLPLPEVPVVPGEPGEVVELAGGGGPDLGVEVVGVGLEVHLAVCAVHGVFIRGILRKIGDEALPDVAVPGQRIF